MKNFGVPVPDEVKASFVVSASGRLENGSTGEVGPLIRLEPVEVGTPMPLRGVSYGVDTVRRILEGKLNPDLPMYTMKHSGQKYILTLADLRLVQKGE